MIFETYKKIYVLGHKENETIFADKDDEIVVEEKIDGGNMRYFIKDGIIIMGSRTQQITSDEGEDANINKMFLECVKLIRETLSKFSKEELKPFEHLIFYGENCVKHTMEYDWKKIPRYLGYDILNTQNNKFIAYPDVKEVFEQEVKLSVGERYKRERIWG